MYRLIDEGKLSVTQDRRGKKVVELSELLRVFGSLLQDNNNEDNQENRRNKSVIKASTTNKASQDTLFSTVQELEKLRHALQMKEMELKLRDKEIELIQDRMNELKQTVEKTDQEKGKLLDIIQSQTLLLTATNPTQKTKIQPKKEPTLSKAKKATKSIKKN